MRPVEHLAVEDVLRAGNLLYVSNWGGDRPDEIEDAAAARPHAGRGDAAGHYAHALAENRAAWLEQDGSRYRRSLTTNRWQDAYELFDRVAYEYGSLVLAQLDRVPGVRDERRDVGAEEVLALAEPDDLVHELFTEHYWHAHPLGRPILGTVDSIDADDTLIGGSGDEDTMVLTGDHDDRVVEILSGLVPGDVVAVGGAFSLSQLRGFVPGAPEPVAEPAKSGDGHGHSH